MNAQPAAFGKAEEQLFAVRFGTEQRRTAQCSLERPGIHSAEDVFVGMQLHGENLLMQAPSPLLAVKFDFGQFGHGADWALLVSLFQLLDSIIDGRVRLDATFYFGKFAAR